MASTSSSKCPVCNKAYTETEMVECTECLKWIHYQCAGVGDEVADYPTWKCKSCELKNINSSILARSKICVICEGVCDKENSVNCISCKKIVHHACAELRMHITEGYQWFCARCCVRTFQNKSQLIDKQVSRSGSVSSHSSRFKLREKLKLIEQKEELLRKQQELISEKQAILDELSEYEVEGSESNSVVSQPNVQIQRANDEGQPRLAAKRSISQPNINIQSSNDHQHQNRQHHESQPIQVGNVQSELFNPLTYHQIATRHTIAKDLPIFSGDPKEWPVFFSTFTQTTQACGLSPAENLIRLQRCLKNKARRVVEAQLTLPSNVPNIMETLRLLFGRPELIIQHHIKEISKMPPPRIEKLESLIEFSIAVRNLCSTFEQAELKYHLYNPVLIQELIDKLPAVMKLGWATHRRTIEDPECIKSLSDWLQEIATDACSVSTEINFSEKKKEPAKSSYINLHEEVQNSRMKTNPLTNRSCMVCSRDCKTISYCSEFKGLKLNQKWDVVKKNNLCRRCLKKHSSKCFITEPCSVESCLKKHHPLLHKQIDANNNQIESQSQTNDFNNEQNENTNVSETNMNHQVNDINITFRILPVLLSTNDKQIKTYAFLDEGSSCTLINDDIVKELQLNGEKEAFCMKWTKGITRLESNSQKVNIQIRGTYPNAPKFNIGNVRTVSSLELPRQTVDYHDLQCKYPHLQNLPIESYQNANPKILIGLANWKMALPLKIKEGGEGEPIAAKCRLGWSVFAVNKATDSPYIYNYHICECSAEKESEFQQLIKEYISVDNLGVNGPVNQIQIQENERAQNILATKTTYSNNRYEIGLLWKYDDFELPDSRPMAMKRLMCLERRLKSDVELAQIMKSQIQDYINKGYIRKLDKDELKQHIKRKWYLPIFPVQNPNKPSKVRIVWDAAAEVNGVSLNTLLLKGADLNSSLLGVLLRCREKKVCISGDIKEMFLQVKIAKEDQHVMRFYWRDLEDSRPPDTYVMQVMSFGATCSPSCAQYIKNQNALTFMHKYPRAVKCIIENHYVDDMIDSVDTESEAIQLAKEVKEIHEKAGFEICNWRSNSVNVMKVLNPEVKLPASKNMNPESLSEKILGMWWCLDTDEFTYSLRYIKGQECVLKGERRPTKRELLRILMSIYDPLGLLGHFLVQLKILIQTLWSNNLDWDDQIKDEQMKSWLMWLKVLPTVENIRIPRCYLRNFPNWHNVEVQLHIFVDASDKISATVAYLRLKKGDHIEVMIVGSKTKIAPIKPRTTPRLELDAAVMGARFSKTIQCHLSIKPKRIFYWCDSKTVLNWLKSDPRQYTKFVAFRVAEVQENSETKDWRYITSKLNVADDATKWTKIPVLEENTRWYRGPDFLYTEEVQWPKDITFSDPPIEELISVHMKAKNDALTSSHCFNFSKWKYALNCAVYVVRAIEIWKSKVCQLKKPVGIHTSNEFMKAELMLFRISQQEAYSTEIQILKTDNLNSFATVNKSSPIYKLSPYLDEYEILRVRGRIDAANCLNEDSKRPIILPRDHPITHLFIKKTHEDLLHQNNETVVNLLRQRFYIPKLRHVVKTVVKECQTCKIRKAVPCIPEMAALPVARLSAYTEPFTYVGVDYFGPILVMVGRRSEKRWGVIFTCLTIRAVHIEISHTLDSDSFILCLHNFIARRGQPREIFCDRGTNFVGAEKLLRKELQNIDIKVIAKHFISPALNWNFNPPLSPHMGGCWERLVRSFKVALYASLPKRTPSDSLLRSCLISAEAIINSRPLTYLPLDSEETEALTPNHFLRSSSSGSKPIGQFSDDAILLKFNYQRKEQFANLCWKRFVREYLPDLTLRSKWFKRVNPIEVGDIVLIIDQESPRNNYPKGRVIKVKTSSDGQVRSAFVQTEHGIFERPAAKIAVLEVKLEESNGTTSSFPVNDVPGGSVEN